MNNKGFTLVEVISVIGILLVISLIAIPSMITLKNKNNNKNYEKIKDTIITSAETYYNNYIELGSVEECYITIEEMASQNLIKTPIINPKTNEEIPLTNYVKIYKEKTGEKYKIKYEYIEGTVTNPVMCPRNVITTVKAYGVDKYPETIGALTVEVKNNKGIEEVKYIYNFYDETKHTTEYMKNLTTATTYCSNSDSDTSNDCNSNNKIELDVLDTGYKGCTTKTSYNTYNCKVSEADSRKGYATETLDNKSYIFYIKDSLNQESIYLVTPKVKIERTAGMITTKSTSVLAALKDNQIIIRVNSMADYAYKKLKIYNVLSDKNNITQTHETVVDIKGPYKYTSDYIYYTLDNWKNGNTSYLKSPRYGDDPSTGSIIGSSNSISITAEEYNNVPDHESLLYTTADNPIEHPTAGNTSEKIKRAFYQFGRSVNINISAPNDNESCEYGFVEDGVFRSLYGVPTEHSALSQLVYKSQAESNEQYVFFKSCKESGFQTETCFTYFETKPEVIVTKIK